MKRLMWVCAYAVIHAGAVFAQEAEPAAPPDRSVLQFIEDFEIAENLRGIELNGPEFEALPADAQTQVLYYQLFSRIRGLSEHAPNLILEGEYEFDLDNQEPFTQLVSLAGALANDLSLGGPFIGAVNQQLGRLSDLRRRINDGPFSEVEKQERLEQVAILEGRLEAQRDLLTDMRNYFNDFVTQDAPALVARAEIDADIFNVRQFTDEIENFTQDLEQLQRFFENEESGDGEIGD